MSHDPYQFIKDDPDDPLAWRLKAVCRQEDPDMFFPTERNEVAQAPAKSICRHCPVIGECLSYAMIHDEAGVWGGLSEYERRAVKKRYSERDLQRLFGRAG